VRGERWKKERGLYLLRKFVIDNGDVIRRTVCMSVVRTEETETDIGIV
jgi:hypothetical protein